MHLGWAAYGLGTGRVAAAALLLLGLCVTPLAADDAATRAKALAAALAGMPAEAAPLRVRVTANVPPTRERRAAGEDAMTGVHDLLVSMAESAGFVIVADRAGVDSPLLALEVVGTESIEEGREATGDDLGRRPGLSAQVRARLGLSRPGSPGWQVPLEGRATRTLRAASDALRADAPYAQALGQAGLMEALLDLVKARGRDGARAVLYAYAETDGAWSGLARDAVHLFEEPAMAAWLVRLLPEERGALGEAAAELLPMLGAAALEPLLAAPREGGLLYRWRRVLVLRNLHAEEPMPGVAGALRQALDDDAQLVRIAALRGLASVEGLAAGETLLAALADPRPSMAQHARLALEGLAGKDLGLDAARWRAWWSEARGAGPAAGAERGATTANRVLLLPFGPRPRRGMPGATVGAKGVDPLAAPLARLAKLQMPNGVWPARASGLDSCETGITAVGLLAYLAAGHGTQAQEPYALAVERATSALLRAQAENEDGPQKGLIGEPYRGLQAGHALATLALLNAWSARPSGALHAAAQKALDWIARARNPYFAWRYGLKPGDNDSFVTSLMLLALRAALAVNEAAAAARLPAPFAVDTEGLDGATAWFEKMTDPLDGRVGYVARGAVTPGYTGEPGGGFDTDLPRLALVAPCALHALLQKAPADAPMVAKQLKLIAAQAPAWPPSRGRVDLLGWWQGGLVFARAPRDRGARPWESATASATTRLFASTEAELVAGDRWGWLCGEGYVLALGVLAATAKDFLPPLQAGRPDLARAAQDAKAAPETRARALAAWAAQAPEKAAAVVAQLLADPDPVLRAGAARALLMRAEAGGDDLAPLSRGFAALEEPDRLAAVRLAATRAPAQEDARALLVTALGDGAPAVRAAAARAWPSGVPLSEVARDVMLQQLGSSHAEVLLAVLGALGREPALLTTARLAPLLAHADPGVRAAAVLRAARSPAPLAERLAILERARRDAPPEVRRAVAEGLGELEAPEAVAALKALLDDADAATGGAARDALARRAAAQPALLDVLVEALGAESPATRMRAAEGLARVGPAAASHADRLHQAIKAEVGRGDKRDAAVLVALADARWCVTRDANAVAGLLQGVVSATDTPLEALVRAVELMGRLPELSEQGDDQRVFTERVRHGPIALAMLNAIADHGARGAHHLPMVEWYLAQARAGSEHHAHATVALRRIRGQ